MKRFFSIVLLSCMMASSISVAEEEHKTVLDSIGGWFSQAAEDTTNWASQAWDDTSSWVSDAATGAWSWVTGAANDAWNWTVGAANDAWAWTVQTADGAWNGVSGFFNPPSTEGVPSIAIEPDLPEGTLKMYLGYPVVKTGLDNGYHNTLEIGKNDPLSGDTVA